MNKSNQIRKGRIVIVKEGITYGNHAGSIVKVLSQESEPNDSLFTTIGQQKHKKLNGRVQCETLDRRCCATYNNKPCVYELISDLRIATELEVKAYQKGIKNILNIEYDQPKQTIL